MVALVRLVLAASLVIGANISNLSADEGSTDPAPSGVEQSVIMEGDDSAVAMPGQDSIVFETPGTVDFGSGFQGGAGGAYDFGDGRNSTITYKMGGTSKERNLQLQ